MPGMNEQKKILTAVERWREAAPALEAERNDRIRNADTKAFIRLCSGLLRAQLPNLPPRAGSGLVEQQRWFRRGQP